jgi:hypothetical protein
MAIMLRYRDKASTAVVPATLKLVLETSRDALAYSLEFYDFGRIYRVSDLCEPLLEAGERNSIDRMTLQSYRCRTRHLPESGNFSVQGDYCWS